MTRPQPRAKTQITSLITCTSFTILLIQQHLKHTERSSVGLCSLLSALGVGLREKRQIFAAFFAIDIDELPWYSNGHGGEVLALGFVSKYVAQTSLIFLYSMLTRRLSFQIRVRHWPLCGCHLCHHRLVRRNHFAVRRRNGKAPSSNVAQYSAPTAA